MIRIPFNPSVSGDQSFRILLDGELATLRLTWNTRSDRWFMTVTDAAGVAYGAVKLVSNYPLLRAYGDLPLRGDFVVYATSSTAAEPISFDELGVSWELRYLGADEMAVWMVTNGMG